MTDTEKIEEFIDSTRREDGVIEIGKYDEDTLRIILQEAITFGKEEGKIEERIRLGLKKFAKEYGEVMKKLSEE